MEACHVPDMQETAVQYDIGVQIGFLEATLPPAIPSPATSFPPVPREVMSHHFGLNAHAVLQPVPLIRTVQETRGILLQIPTRPLLRARGNEVLGCLLRGCPDQGR